MIAANDDFVWATSVFPVKTTNAMFPIQRVYSANTYSQFQPSQKRVSEVSDWSYECSKRSERRKTSKRSEALHSEWAEWAMPVNRHSERLSHPLPTWLPVSRNAPKMGRDAEKVLTLLGNRKTAMTRLLHHRLWRNRCWRTRLWQN